MLGEADRNKIKEAIETAARKRDQLFNKIKELEDIKKEITKLEGFINQGKILLGLEPIAASLDLAFQEESQDSVRPTLEKKISEGIYEILIESGRPMNPLEIANEFYKRGWRLSRANGREVLRAALKRNFDIFDKKTDGTYDLKNRMQ